jgi:mannose-1-phosphate guanylyltransferase
MKTVAIVMAGGQGTRFWPLSRKSRPKQLLNMVGDESMLSLTVRRLEAVVPKDQILIVTGRDIEAAVREDLPQLPPENILAEPQGRNTAPCVAWAAVTVRDRFGPDTVISVFPADHYIADDEAFQNAFTSAAAYAQQKDIVTLGITPTRPETGYGYLRFGDFCPEITSVPCRVRKLQAFVEKPTFSQALTYLREGRYLWNSGMFFFRADVILEEFQAHLPDVLALMNAVSDAEGEDSYTEALEHAYQASPSISIDYGIMEHSERIVTIPSNLGWSDVGNWRALMDFRDEGQNCYIRGEVYAEESSGSVLIADEGRVLVTLGVNDLTVVACGDVTMVLPVERAQEVKDLVDLMRKRGKEGLLV